MKWIPLEQGIKGIIMAKGKRRLLKLHAWYDGADIVPIYEDQTYFVVPIQCFYIPLREGERVSQVWIINDRERLFGEIEIAVRKSSELAYAAA